MRGFESVTVWVWIVAAMYGMSLWAAPVDTSWHQAEVYFEAGDYDRARMQLELLEDHLEDWQKMILAYDIGTIGLAQGRWEDAIAEYQKVGSGSQTLPALAQRLTANKALAHLLLAQRKWQALDVNPAGSDEDYQTLILAFRYVLEDIDEAKEAACVLAQVEGAQICKTPYEIEQMYLVTKELLAQVLHSYTDYKISHTSIESGAAMLIAGEGAIIEHLAFLQDAALATALRKQYVGLYLQRAESWLLLWNSLQQLVHKDAKTTASTELEVQYEQAYQFFKEGLALMRQGDFVASTKAFQSSMEALDMFLHLAFQDKPVNEALHRLLVAYGIVLGQDPLQEISLEALEKTQIKVHDLVEKADISNLKEGFQQVDKGLTAGKQALSYGRQYQARIWIESAQNVLKEMVESQDKLSAKMLLQSILNGERFSLRLSHLWQQAKRRENVSPEVIAVVVQQQQATLQKSQRFIPTAMAQQKQEFAADRQHPWDEIISLFLLGERAASMAKEKQEDSSALDDAIVLQEVAVKEWKEALDKLQAEQTKSQQQTPATGGSTAEKSAAAANAPINQVLRLVQEMENEDHSKPGIKTAPSKKGEERPW